MIPENQDTGRSHGACKPLLDACTPLIYANNAFRITGLPVDASTRDIKRRIDDLKAADQMGDAEAEHTHAFALDPPPSVEIIREAAQRLQDPEHRIIEEFFWFWPDHRGTGQQDPALRSLLKSDTDSAVKQWQADIDAPNKAAAATAKHNLAVMYHLLALDWEQSFQGSANPPDPERLEKVNGYWCRSFEWWRGATDDEAFWSVLTQRIRKLDDARLPTGFARRMRASFCDAMCKINATLAVSLVEKGKLDLARRHINYVNETHHGPDSVSIVFALVSRPVRSRIISAIELAKTSASRNPSTADQAAFSLIGSTRDPILVLKTLYKPGDHELTDVCDAVAEACLDCQAHFAKSGSNSSQSLKILEAASAIAASVETKTRVEDKRTLVKSDAVIAPIRALCESAAKAAEANPASADKEAQRILSAAPQLLSNLSGCGLPKTTTDRAKDEVALAAMHCAVVYGNKTEKWKQCIAILEQSLRLAVTADVRDRLTKNLQTVRDNNNLFGNLTPISSAPTLSTINGIGLTLYGCTDKDPATGSYLATYYFVFIGIPIFPICRYRVISDGSRYRFFGKAPLRTFDRWHLAVTIGLILWMIIAINSSGGTPVSSRSSAPQPAYAPQSAPPAFNASAPSRAQPSSTRDTYRIPSSVTAELEATKQQINAEKAKADAIESQLATARRTIEAAQLQTDALQNQLDTLRLQIDRDRIYLDQTSQSAINSFNANVNRYNTLLKTVRAENATANESIDTYNLLVEQAKAQNRVVNQMVQSYNAKLRQNSR